jgi:hypothetical protein
VKGGEGRGAREGGKEVLQEPKWEIQENGFAQRSLCSSVQ